MANPTPPRRPSLADMGGLRGYAKLQGWDYTALIEDIERGMTIADLRRRYLRQADGSKFSRPWIRELRKRYQAELAQGKEGQS